MWIDNNKYRVRSEENEDDHGLLVIYQLFDVQIGYRRPFYRNF